MAYLLESTANRLNSHMSTNIIFLQLSRQENGTMKLCHGISLKVMDYGKLRADSVNLIKYRK